jgi:hypothetical protein
MKITRSGLVAKLTHLLGALATLLVSNLALADWGWMPCPRWTYGWETKPEVSARKYAISQVGVSCYLGSSCAPDYPNPTAMPCLITTVTSIYCGAGGTGPATMSARQGTTNTSPVIRQDTQGKWHCAVNSPDINLKDLGNNNNDCGNCKGNPVNIGQGNKIQREVDLVSLGDGGLEFSRFYNSMAPAWQFNIGTNWTHTYSRWVKLMTDDEVYAKIVGRTA